MLARRQRSALRGLRRPTTIRARTKVEASVARCLRTPPSGANPLGLQIGLSDCLRSQSNRSIVVVGNYEFGPITPEPCRAKVCPLRPRRSYFAPAGAAPQSNLTVGISPAAAEPRTSSDTGGGAGYCPRVRWVYYDIRLSL